MVASLYHALNNEVSNLHFSNELLLENSKQVSKLFFKEQNVFES